MIVAAPDAPGAVSMSKGWVVLPSGTVTAGGTVTNGLLLASDTATPPAGAGAVSVMMPCSDWPAFATRSESTTPCSASATCAVTVSDAVCDVPEYVAVIVATADVFVVEIANDWLVDPAVTVIADGTVTALLLLASVTAMPPVGAAVESDTVPVTVVAPETVVV